MSRLTDKQCKWINENHKPSMNLSTLWMAFNKHFDLDMKAGAFKDRRSKAMVEKRVRGIYVNRYTLSPKTLELNKLEQMPMIKKRIAGLCREDGCQEKTPGLFCENHVRQGYPQDMSSPRTYGVRSVSA